jgi:hypothetical protein
MMKTAGFGPPFAFRRLRDWLAFRTGLRSASMRAVRDM